MAITVALKGKVGNDVIQRTTKAGKLFHTFGVVVNGTGTDKGEWVDVSVFDSTALPEGLAKGAMVSVEGRGSMNRWVGKDGTARCNLRVAADVVEVGKPDAPARSNGPAHYASPF